MAAREKMAEVARLAAILCDGQMTEAEMAELDALLRDDPAAQLHYRQYISLDVALAWKFVDRSFQPQAAPPRPPALGFLGDLFRWGENLPGMRMFSWMLAGFLGMLLGLPTIMAILAVLGPAKQPAARLVATSNCRWSDAAAALPAGNDLRPGQRIDLEAGEAQIAFARGGGVTLLGPGAVEVLSDSGARLLVGKLTVRAETENSHGFAVCTPAMTLVDLGTEFGVFVPGDGVEEVHVFRGQVRAELGSGGWFETGNQARGERSSPLPSGEGRGEGAAEKGRNASNPRSPVPGPLARYSSPMRPCAWTRGNGPSPGRRRRGNNSPRRSTVGSRFRCLARAWAWTSANPTRIGGSPTWTTKRTSRPGPPWRRPMPASRPRATCRRPPARRGSGSP